ncbi:hypothetical protein BDV95DRAFT_246343 [Massariosphaeria phaeospora]|uniref:Uncharacterized protein n=1 Tax=Massariosphaeria phaeospora TaxID=100035 RepID=A0A7C8I5L7_9PLEO|nr:hypothetical protein BDV95DRAFT_246343 [Massariosphaeria phaeospora]
MHINIVRRGLIREELPARNPSRVLKYLIFVRNNIETVSRHLNEPSIRLAPQKLLDIFGPETPKQTWTRTSVTRPSDEAYLEYTPPTHDLPSLSLKETTKDIMKDRKPIDMLLLKMIFDERCIILELEYIAAHFALAENKVPRIEKFWNLCRMLCQKNGNR